MKFLLACLLALSLAPLALASTPYERALKLQFNAAELKNHQPYQALTVHCASTVRSSGISDCIFHFINTKTRRNTCNLFFIRRVDGAVIGSVLIVSCVLDATLTPTQAGPVA